MIKIKFKKVIELFYYYATIQDETINFEREATAEEYNNLEPHISKISKMLVDKQRIDIVFMHIKRSLKNLRNSRANRMLHITRAI